MAQVLLLSVLLVAQALLLVALWRRCCCLWRCGPGAAASGSFRPRFWLQRCCLHQLCDRDAATQRHAGPAAPMLRPAGQYIRTHAAQSIQPSCASLQRLLKISEHHLDARAESDRARGIASRVQRWLRIWASTAASTQAHTKMQYRRVSDRARPQQDHAALIHCCCVAAAERVFTGNTVAFRVHRC